MAEINYAFIKNGEVINIAVFEDSADVQLLECFKNEFLLDSIIIATEKTFVGGTHDGEKFWPPKPYPSWIKNEELNEWVAPVSQPEFDPENPIFYIWNEELLNWEEISE
jgi:hypothetical protein